MTRRKHGRFARAKIGTHSVQRILVVRGELRLGSRIEWIEGLNPARTGRRHRGIIDRIGDDGLIVVERM